MNLGINDAVALGKALSGILGGASPNLLDSYDQIQRPIAKQVIWITNFLTKTATLPESIGWIRNLIVGALSPIISGRVAQRLSLLSYLKEGRHGN
jgi:2-polyprenyl-6-methoxyphenol hydroxylase-like FAD-dependent oxidoreductase